MTDNTPGLSPRPADALVDSLLRDIRFSQMRALLLLSHHGSLHAASKSSGENFTSLSSQVRRLNEWFRQNLHVDLIDDVSGRVVLTESGRLVASQLDDIPALLKLTLEGLESSSVPLLVPCTSDCIDDLADFIAQVPSGVTQRAFAEKAITTSEFNPFQCGGIHRPILSLGSKYMSGSSLALPDYFEILRLRERPIVAITNEDPNEPLGLDDRPVSITDLLRARVRLLTSIGGVAWDFLGEYAPAVQDGLRNGTHGVVHDLQFGLKLLARGAPLTRRGVMLVHGVEGALASRSPKYPILNNFRCYSLVESNEVENRAVTALFYNRRAARQCSSHVQAAYEALWQAARAITAEESTD